MTPDELAVLVEASCLDGWATIPSNSDPDVRYRLTVIHDWPEACTCTGYSTRGDCSHLAMAREVWARTVDVGRTLTEKNERLAMTAYRILDQDDSKPTATHVLWLHRPISDHTTDVTFERQGDEVGVSVVEDLPGAEQLSATAVPFGAPLPLAAVRRLIDGQGPRRLLWEFASTALTGEPSPARPLYWYP